jgi:hypothetical protein
LGVAALFVALFIGFFFHPYYKKWAVVSANGFVISVLLAVISIPVVHHLMLNTANEPTPSPSGEGYKLPPGPPVFSERSSIYVEADYSGADSYVAARELSKVLEANGLLAPDETSAAVLVKVEDVTDPQCSPRLDQGGPQNAMMLLTCDTKIHVIAQHTHGDATMFDQYFSGSAQEYGDANGGDGRVSSLQNAVLNIYKYISDGRKT